MDRRGFLKGVLAGTMLVLGRIGGATEGVALPEASPAAGGGTALSDFADFVESRGPTYMTSMRDVIDEAARNTYVFGRRRG